MLAPLGPSITWTKQLPLVSLNFDVSPKSIIDKVFFNKHAQVYAHRNLQLIRYDLVHEQ